MTGTKKTDPDYFVYERGGLTGDAESEAAPVARFAYCKNCEREVPVDSDNFCMHCYQAVPALD